MMKAMIKETWRQISDVRAKEEEVSLTCRLVILGTR